MVLLFSFIRIDQKQLPSIMIGTYPPLLQSLEADKISVDKLINTLDNFIKSQIPLSETSEAVEIDEVVEALYHADCLAAIQNFIDLLRPTK